jgi:hypothetical protein
MNPLEIDQSIGSEAERHEQARQLAQALAELLSDHGYDVHWVDQDRPVRTSASSRRSEVFLEYRAKASQSIAEKMARFGEDLREILDIYGIRVVVSDAVELDLVAKLVWEKFLVTPTTEEMTIRGGTMFFAPFRDYRKRDWVGVSPATTNGYVHAIHMNRRGSVGSVEVQVLTAELYASHGNPTSSDSHAMFKERQRSLFGR